MKMSHEELSSRFPKLSSIIDIEDLEFIQLSFDVVPEAHLVNGCNVAFKAIEDHLSNKLKVKSLSRIELNEIMFVLMQFASLSRIGNPYHIISSTMMIKIGQLLKKELK